MCVLDIPKNIYIFRIKYLKLNNQKDMMIKIIKFFFGIMLSTLKNKCRFSFKK